MRAYLFAQHVHTRLKALRDRSMPNAYNGPLAGANAAMDEFVDELVLLVAELEEEVRPDVLTPDEVTHDGVWVPCLCSTPDDHARDCPARAAQVMLGQLPFDTIGTGSVEPYVPSDYGSTQLREGVDP